jgi:hypothetical protein
LLRCSNRRYQSVTFTAHYPTAPRHFPTAVGFILKPCLASKRTLWRKKCLLFKHCLFEKEAFFQCD